MFESYKLDNNEKLSSIASRFNTSVKVLQDLNNLYYLDALREGDEIIVPAISRDYFNYYKVEKGDSLYKIARDYNINPELLASFNGLNTTDYIYPNQQILIPKSGYSYYITAEGDTLDEVAKVFGVDVNKLLKENTTVYLMSGQLLANKKLDK